jgi:hypothetical protein
MKLLPLWLGLVRFVATCILPGTAASRDGQVKPFSAALPSVSETLHKQWADGLRCRTFRHSLDNAPLPPLHAMNLHHPSV